MAKLDFPAASASPFIAPNGVTYTYIGTEPNGYWSGTEADGSTSLEGKFVEIAGDDMSGDLTLGTNKIKLDATDGSSTFVGRLDIDRPTPATLATFGAENKVNYNFVGNLTGAGVTPGTVGLSIGTNLFNIPDDSNIFLGLDGSATFAGGDISLNANGSITGTLLSLDRNISSVSTTLTVSDRGTRGLQIFGGGTTHIGGTLSGNATTDSPNIALNADGSATFAGTSSNPGVALNKAGSSFRQGSIDAYGTNYNSSSASLLRVRSDEGGGGTVQMNLTANGNVSFRGTVSPATVLFNLEADDDTKYTSTTDVDGNVTLVYNGAVLDVKDRLQKADAALLSLKTAAAAATDFDSLKSAIATALANI